MQTLQLRKADRQQAVTAAVACSGCLVLFGFLISCPAPLKWAGLIPLLFAGFLISRNITFINKRISVPYNGSLNHSLVFYCSLALLLGFAGALYYRGSYAMPLWPVYFQWFSGVAVGIGLLEELLFRGFIQTRLQAVNPRAAILFAALAHAAYKSSLFLSPAMAGITSIWLFFTYSFFAFVLLGMLRYWSGSLWPPILVHAVFDLLVYAENTEAPVWVW